MGRKSTISDSAVFAAVGLEVARSGRLTMDALREATGISTGSVYHRYQSREGLLAQAWLFALEEFQGAFVRALDAPGAFPGEQAALATPRFSREQRDLAIILACGSVSQFLSDHTPEDVMDRIRAANDRARSAMEDFSQKHGYRFLACRLALATYPLASVKTFLPEQVVPGDIDEYVREVCRTTLGVGAVASKG